MGGINNDVTLAALSKKSTMALVFSTTCLSEFARGLLADATSATASLTESGSEVGVAIPLPVTTCRAAESAALPV